MSISSHADFLVQVGAGYVVKNIGQRRCRFAGFQPGRSFELRGQQAIWDGHL